MEKYIKRLIKNRSLGICERCNTKPAAHIHHLTYKRKGHERPEDLQHVCLECHEFYHPHHNFTGHNERTREEKKMQMTWGRLERQAHKELNGSARFNRLGMEERRFTKG